MENKKTVLLGIGGGIAAYKSIQVASSMFQTGFDVHVAMSPSSREFVTALSFSAVINRQVLSSIFPESRTDDREDIYPHLFPANHADIFVLLPATANMIAKIAHGFGSEIVSTCALSLPENCKRYYCPAMNAEMWQQKTVQKNLELLDESGWHRIGPEHGYLACGVTGEGRMSEPESIVNIISDTDQPESLTGKRVLILSGPTLEHIDPVRYISNGSSGKMGKELALAAVSSGAEVDFISGPVSTENLPVGKRINVKNILSAKEMLYEAENCFPKADIAIFVAAVSDYMPIETNSAKLPKCKEEFALKLESTPDIAASLGTQKSDKQICLGFALETDPDAVDRAQAKLQSKNLDAIILNGIKSFGGEKGHFIFISDRKDTIEEWGVIHKKQCARQIIDKLGGLVQHQY